MTNTGLNVPDLPGWHEWAAKAKSDLLSGRTKITVVGKDPPPQGLAA